MGETADWGYFARMLYIWAARLSNLLAYLAVSILLVYLAVSILLVGLADLKMLFCYCG